MVQGSADTINVPACSIQIYDAAKAPRYYLDLLGAPHEPPYTEPGTTYEDAVAKVTTDFFDVELASQGAAIGAMMADGNVTGAARITGGPSAPSAAPPGGCPGAPG